MEISEIKELGEQLKSEVAEFKKTNQERLEAKADGKAFGELEAKVNKNLDALLELKERSEKLEALSKKSLESKESNYEQKNLEYKQASRAYLTGNTNGLELKTLQERIDTDGGFLVMPDRDTEIGKRVFETSPVRQVASLKSISSNQYVKVVQKTRTTGGGFFGELETVTNATTGTFGQITIPVLKDIVSVPMSTEIFEDASIDLEAEILEQASLDLSLRANTAYVSGSGAKAPKGFLSYTAWTTNGTYEFDKIEQVNSGSSGALTVAGIISLQNALKEAYQANAVFMMKRETFGSLVKLNGTDNYFFNTMLDKNAGLSFSILGKPVVFASDMPAIGANSLSIAYGDFSKGYTIVDRLGTKILKDPYSTPGQVTYRVERRTGGAVTDFDAIKLQKLAS